MCKTRRFLSRIIFFALVINSFAAFASANEGAIQTDKAQVNTNGEDEFDNISENRYLFIIFWSYDS